MTRIVLAMAVVCGLSATASAQYRGYLPAPPAYRTQTNVSVYAGRGGVDVQVQRRKLTLAQQPAGPYLQVPPAAVPQPQLQPEPAPLPLPAPPAPSVHQHLPAPPAYTPQPAPQAYAAPPVVVHRPPALRPGQFVHGAVPVFGRIRVEDRDNIHPHAVHATIAVCDPNGRGCVFVPICVPPCAPERIKVEKNGTEIKLDYGKYEVEIKSRRGQIEVDYDD